MKLGRGEGGGTKGRTFSAGHKPTQGSAFGAGHEANPSRPPGLARGSTYPTGPYEVYISFLNGFGACRLTASMLCGSRSQERQEIGAAADAAYAVLECVVKRDEELEPLFDS